MKSIEECLAPVCSQQGVKGVTLVAQKEKGGEILTTCGAFPDVSKSSWLRQFNPPEDTEEIELIYDNDRVLFRRAPQGWIVAWLEPTAPLSMIKINCDLAVDALKELGSKKGFLGIFGK